MNPASPAQEHPEDPTAPLPQDGELYDAYYYANDLGIPYERNDHWLTFFGMVADRIVALTEPRTALDVGCAMGFLVEALRDRGVDARGTDVSSYAVSQAGGSAVGHCEVKSALEPIEGRFDLITCIEVVEHLGPDEGRIALGHMAAATDTILLSTTPEDFEEPTHINVQPVEYWTELMAGLGFFRDVDADTGFLTPWAGLFRRANPTRARVARDYERSEYRFRHEALALRQQLLVLHNRLSAQGGDAVSSDGAIQPQLRIAIDAAIAAEAARGAAEAEARQLRVALEAGQVHLAQIDALLDSLKELERARDRLDAIETSTTWRLTWKLLAPYRRLLGRS